MIEKLEETTTTEPGSFLLDTCFLIYELEKDNQAKLENFCLKNHVYMTSFNIEELEKAEKRIPNIKHRIHSFLKKKLLKKLVLDIHIGEVDKEREYAQEILETIADPSDAVLVKAAILTKSNILTRDKHHIFTPKAEDLLNKKGIEIRNKL